MYALAISLEHRIFQELLVSYNPPWLVQPTHHPFHKAACQRQNSDAARLTRCRHRTCYGDHVRIYDRRLTGVAPGSTMTSSEGDPSRSKPLQTSHGLPGQDSRWHLVFLFHIQPAVQDAGAESTKCNICTLLSSSINARRRSKGQKEEDNRGLHRH